ncbi:MAG: tetratricopeptide repeat protein [Planctomycetes bacterium]|nr:tetratricopeptide repeat protein [Planctomycetota bacterium]
MRQRLSQFALGLFGTALCISAGCLGIDRKTFDPGSLKVNSEMESPQKMELPTKEGAKACLATAQMLEKSGKNPEAIALYEKARTSDPSHKNVCRRLAVLYDRQGEFEKAEIEYNKAIALFPRDANLLNDAGYSNFCRGNWTLAEDYLRQAIEIDPDMKRAWTNLGMVQVHQGKVSAAYETFLHAVPEPQARCNLAFAFILMGNQKDAIAQYRLALELDPNLQIARDALTKLENPKPKGLPVIPKKSLSDPTHDDAPITTADLPPAISKTNPTLTNVSK